MTLRPPTYLAKIINLSGTTIAEPLPAANVRFTRRISLPGQQSLGDFEVELLPARGPGAQHAVIYEQLDYMQRVEIYEDEIVGDPVFSGYIENLPSDLERESISGPEWLGKLGQRRLHHFQELDGDIDDSVKWLLKTWQTDFKDNFNRASIGSDWTVYSGSWDINSNRLRTTGGSSNIIYHTLGLSGTEEDEFRCQVDLETGSDSATWEREIAVFQGGSNPWTLTIEHVDASDDFTRLTLAQSASSTSIQRDASEWELPFDEWCTIDIWIHDNGSTQTAEVWLNGRQFLVEDSTSIGTGGALALIGVGSGCLFDNAIIWIREATMAEGTIASTSSTDTQEFPQDTHLQVLSYLVDILDWEWRTTAKAGAGNDEIDVGAGVGSDVSDDVVFEEGCNLTNLNLAASASKLTTLIRFMGQGQDENQMLAQAIDFDAWDDYGIIEEQINDQRISTNALARTKAENELVKRKDGQASLSATVIESPATIGQWREGDTVWVKATRPDMDQTARVLEVEYVSGSLERRVTFDKFPRSRSGHIGQLMDDMGKVNRGTKGNAGNVVLHFKPESRWVDDFDRRIRYVSGANPWESWTGGAATGAYNATLHGSPDNDNYCEFDFEGTGIAVICRKGPNLVNSADSRYMNIYIDGSLEAQVSLYNSSNIDQQEVWSTTSLDSGPHTIKLQRAGSADLNVFIDIDAFRIYGWVWQFYLEGRAVNSAKLSWKSSNSSAAIKVEIDGTDRTSALGGGSGFTGDQTDIDVHQFISAPGLHTIEFINSSSSYETMIEASLVCKVLV